MPSFPNLERQNWTRRQLIKWSIAGLGMSCAAIKFSSLAANSANPVRIPPTVSDSYGIQASWQISDRIIIGGWGALSKVTTPAAL